MSNMYQMTMENVRRETYMDFCNEYVNDHRLFNNVRTKFVGNELHGTVTIYSTRSEHKESFNKALELFMNIFYTQK